MIDVEISEKLNNKILKIMKKMSINDSELSGPLFGHFELRNKKKILVLDNFFDRTILSTMGSTEFEFHNDFFIKRETKKGNKWVGTLHTHPFMSLKPSSTDRETSRKIQQKLGIQVSAYIIVGKTKFLIWKETNETIKFKDSK